jgi:hypothetical protein
VIGESKTEGFGDFLERMWRTLPSLDDCWGVSFLATCSGVFCLKASVEEFVCCVDDATPTAKNLLGKMYHCFRVTFGAATDVVQCGKCLLVDFCLGLHLLTFGKRILP